MAAPSGVPALSSPVTAAGPQGICTPFPFHPDTGNLVPAGFYPIIARPVGRVKPMGGGEAIGQ